MEELWKPISGYEGLYEVSNLGRVKGLFRRVQRRSGLFTIKETILKPTRVSHGNLSYLRVSLSIGNIRKSRLVSNLVCEAFHGPRPDGCECCHKNEDSLDNRAFNLEWGDPAKNDNMPKRKERIRNQWRLNKYEHLKKPVLQFTKDGVLIAEYESCKAAARETGVKDSNLIACCKGNSKSAGGFVWRYK